MKELIKALEDLGYEEIYVIDEKWKTISNDTELVTLGTFSGNKRFFTKKQEKTLDEICEDWESKHGYTMWGETNPVARKVNAIQKVLAVADYLNGDWEADWENNNQVKWNIYYNESCKINMYQTLRDNFAHFKDEETANKAIEILGEKVIKEAYS